MTTISRLQIHGFKGIEDLEMSAERINIITGRNNSGKTSLLEAIDLGFNPGNVTKFGKDIRKCIHVRQPEADIDIEFSSAQPPVTANFTENGAITKRNVNIREPTNEEAREIFSETLQDLIDLNEDYPVHRRLATASVFNRINEQGLRQRINEALEESIAELPEEVAFPAVRNNAIIFRVDDRKYRFIHLGDYFEAIRRSLVTDTAKRLEESEAFQFEDVANTQDELQKAEHSLHRTISSKLAPRFGASRFLGDSPDSIDGVKLVTSPKLEANEVNISEEKAAVRKSNVEDYLKENDIVENLNDFSFDKLVFEEEDGKYEVPYSFMGDGFKTIVGILWELFAESQQGNVLLLEEPGVHMHPGYVETVLQKLVTIVREENLQLFITTHNLDFIKGFFSETIESQEGAFLKDNFSILQLTEPLPRSLGYEQAMDEVENLNVDLRGI